MLGDYIPASPPAYSVFYSNSFEGQGHHGGSAILVRRDIPCTSQELDTPLQAIAVKVFIDRPYTMCSLYLPPSVTVERGDLNHLVQDLPSPFILMVVILCGVTVQSAPGVFYWLLLLRMRD
ncbi:hypothetical protein Pcinc_000038 [Petrolisthes cinctipes]|uniref:Uncharacterized protein n=1 Tax=Petrolisthes cinctipes TaxID=88211 RepID=A0AAE1GNK6_PETCI|nr:hypothetical protein Pcinc_000038 [Petrolisthes cinctipes]